MFAMRWWKCQRSGRYTGRPVLDPLGDDEARVEERDGEDDERPDERDQGVRLQRALDDHAAEQVAQEIGAAVPHEDRRGVEVVDEEPERRAGDDRGEHRGVVLAEVEGDDRERRRRDRPDARREAVDAVGEVDDVDEADHGDERERATGVAELHPVDEGQREVRDLDAAAHRDVDRERLAGELDGRMEVDEVVDRADQRDDRGAEEDRRERAAVRQPQPGGEEDAGEDGQAAEERRLAHGEPARTGRVDRAGASGDPPDERRERRGDARRGGACEQRVDRGQVGHGPGVWQAHRSCRPSRT